MGMKETEKRTKEIKCEKEKSRKKKVTAAAPYLGVAAIAAVVLYCIVTPDFFWSMVKEVRQIYYGRICMTGCVCLLGVYACFARFDGDEKKEKRKGILLFLMTPVVAFLMLEYASSAGPSMIWSVYNIVAILRSIMTIAIIFIILITFFAVFNSMFASGVVICAMVVVFDLANYFTYQFRGIPLLATDLSNTGTALSVAGSYEYLLGFHQLMMVICMAEWCILLWRMKKSKLPSRKIHAVCAGAAVVIFTGCVLVALFTPIVSDVANVYVSTFRPNKSYKKNGAILTFIQSIRLMEIEEPEGYSVEAVEEIAKKYQSDENAADAKTPNVIAIMDEAFADLQSIAEFETSEELMPFYKSLTENAVKGTVHVSVLGGQTVNSEFEFLTGLSTAFMPENATAYRLYIKNPLPNLTSILREQDYQGLIALHPYQKNGYNRQSVYPLLGFEEFISIENMKYGAEDKLRCYISDDADMKMVVEQYEKAKDESDAPFYLFNVTMQNHSGYLTKYKNFDTPISVEQSLASDEITYYVNLVRKTDEALQHLIEYFEDVEEPTVIVFFGDHAPRLSDEFYSKLLGKDMENFSRKDMLELYQTPFLIWANYDIEEAQDVHISTNYLCTTMLEAAGMELTPFHQYLSELKETLPIITAKGYYGENGKLYQVDDEDSPYYELLQEYERIQYNNLFDTNNRIENFFE